MSIHLIFKELGEIAVIIFTTLEFSRVKNPLVSLIIFKHCHLIIQCRRKLRKSGGGGALKYGFLKKSFNYECTIVS